MFARSIDLLGTIWFSSLAKLDRMKLQLIKEVKAWSYLSSYKHAAIVWFFLAEVESNLTHSGVSHYAYSLLVEHFEIVDARVTGDL